MAYSPQRERTRADRFAKLGLKDPGPHVPLGKIPQARSNEIQRSNLGAGRVFFVPRPIELEDGPIVKTYREFLDFADEKRILVEPDDPEVYVFNVPLDDGVATVLSNRTAARRTIRLANAQLTIDPDYTGLIAVDGRGRVTSAECSGKSTHAGSPITSGDAHIMLTALDDQDIRQSRHLMLLPITPGTLKIHTRADWKGASVQIGAWFQKGSGTVVRSTPRAVPATVPDPFLNHAQIGQYAGSQWETLKTMPLKVQSGTIHIELDDDMARSILILR